MSALDSYQRRLVVFLSVATFFEGYDMFALSQLLPELRAHFHLDETQGGVLLTVVAALAIGMAQSELLNLQAKVSWLPDIGLQQGDILPDLTAAHRHALFAGHTVFLVNAR